MHFSLINHLQNHLSRLANWLVVVNLRCKFATIGKCNTKKNPKCHLARTLLWMPQLLRRVFSLVVFKSFKLWGVLVFFVVAVSLSVLASTRIFFFFSFYGWSLSSFVSQFKVLGKFTISCFTILEFFNFLFLWNQALCHRLHGTSYMIFDLSCLKSYKPRSMNMKLCLFPKNGYTLNMKWLWLCDTIFLILKF